MRRIFIIFAVISFLPASAGVAEEALFSQTSNGIQLTQAAALSDDELRDHLIARSIAGYAGSCACPYSRARNGSRCGKRSAWSRPGGAKPLCFREDIPDAMLRRFRAARS